MRDARINQVAGDVLAIGIKQWHVIDVEFTHAIVMRESSITSMSLATFRSFFKLASTVRYGDEGK